MKILLVHGAWHGAWSWQKLTPFLEAKSAEVHNLTLTGLGERKHLLSDSITYETHKQDILNYIDYQDLDEITLIGHSYGGTLAATITEIIPEKVNNLILLDSTIPANGQSALDILEGTHLGNLIDEQIKNNDVFIKAPPAEVFGITDKLEIQWVNSKLTLHPINVMKEPMQLSNNSNVNRYYIDCTHGEDLEFVNRLKEFNFNYYTMKTGHDVMITKPRELSKLIFQITAD